MRCVSVGWHEASERELPRVVLSFRPDVLGLYRKLFNGTAVHGRWAREPAEVMGLQICMQKLIVDRDDRLLYARDLVNTLLASINGRLIDTYFNKLLLKHLQVQDADTVPRDAVRCFSHAFARSGHLEHRHFEFNMRTIFVVLKSAPQHAKTFPLRRNTTLDAEVTSIQSLERKLRIFEKAFRRSPEEFYLWIS